ncbi:hypothetical protein N7501_008515 [Penicillium viridicatum]|nr:hypothetical protein N7501_008515 [Penicillium viridicatum]
MGGNNNIQAQIWSITNRLQGVKSLRLGTSIHIKYDEVRPDRPEQIGSSIGPKGADHDDEVKELEACLADNARDINTWPLNLQTETPLISRPFALNGKVYQTKGTCDNTLWYGDKGGPDKAINLVLVEARKLGLASSGDDQALGCMACVHQERRSCPSRNSTVYGLSTDGEGFRFLRINQKGVC